MQDYRSNQLCVDCVTGAVFSTFGTVVSWSVGMMLMGPLAVAVAWMTALPIKASLAITAGGLAVFSALLMILLLRRAARHRPFLDDDVFRVSLRSCVVGTFIGQAIAWLLLNGAILPPS